MAKESHAKLYVLHSILPELYGVEMRGPVPELALMDLQNARENLHRYVEHIPELRTVKHKEIVFLGSASDAIQSAGESNGIDLLVLGSHGRHGLAKLTLGSVAEWAIRRLTLSRAGGRPNVRQKPTTNTVDCSGDRSFAAGFAPGSVCQLHGAGL